LNNHFFLILAICFTLFINSKANAQEGFSVGLKGGAGFSQYYFVLNNNSIDQNFVLVIQKGFLINYRDEKNFGMQLEIMQTQKAFEENISKTYKQRVVLDYLEFPLLSSYKIGKGKSGLVLTAGFHVSHASKATHFITGHEMAGDTSVIQYSNFVYNTWDYGLNGGFGYQFKFGRNIIHIEALYSQGFNNLFDRDYTATYRSLNQSLYLNLVYKFCLTNNVKIKSIQKK